MEQFPQPLMTIQEVATRLHVSIRSVERLVEGGKLRCYRIELLRARRFKPDEVERLLLREEVPEEKDKSLDAFIRQSIDQKRFQSATGKDKTGNDRR